ncbi:MAG: hypothetical protein MRZ31_02045 [Dysosmobacter sp.]|uniref:hypothetical protein n=1 Tax=Dysosmobacter sp. TaxID=2591382 RepID=UPI0026721F1F|nr:hypothetical protein [Dysosmobacter sp.]MCI6015462.1 hypothetical protein [Dysosmobacter sp.]
MKKLTEQDIQELDRLEAIPQEKRTEAQRARYRELAKRLLEEKLVAWPDDEED